MKKLIKSFYTLFVVFTLLSILAIYAFSPNFSNALNAHIGAHSETDISVLVVALITFIAAAATLLVSWLIKEEAAEIGDRATEIGNRIILGTTLQRYIDRLLYEYSDVIERTYESIKDDPELKMKIDDSFHLLVSLYSWDWFKKEMMVKESDTAYLQQFIDNLLPGEFGKKFVGHFSITKIQNLLAEAKELEKTDESAKTILQSGDQKQIDVYADQRKMQIITNGQAVFLLMRLLAWVPQTVATKRLDKLLRNYDQEKWSPSLLSH